MSRPPEKGPDGPAPTQSHQRPGWPRSPGWYQLFRGMEVRLLIRKDELSQVYGQVQSLVIQQQEKYDFFILVYTVLDTTELCSGVPTEPKLSQLHTASEKMTESRQKRSQSLKTAYGSVYADVSRLLREADPIGLIAIGAPDDEYDPEISTILPRLHEARAAVDVQRIVHEEFVRWFGADLIGPLADYAEVAERIWRTWLDCGQGT